MEQNGQLVLTAEHVFSAFAVTKRLGREINTALANELTREEWARIAVADLSSVTSKDRNSSGWRRSLLGYVRQNYATVSVPEADLEAAARTISAWTRARWE